MRKIIILSLLFVIGCNQQDSQDFWNTVSTVGKAGTSGFAATDPQFVYPPQFDWLEGQMMFEQLERQQQQMRLDRFLGQQEQLRNQQNWEYWQDWGRRTFPDYPWP